MTVSISVSVIIVTKNEEKHIESCLKCLTHFDDVWLVDSHSDDKTIEIAKKFQVHIVPFQWNGQYPKKRQWCLDNLDLKNDWVLFVDADEMIPSDLVDEISRIVASNPEEAGFFIMARYRLHGKILRYGLQNKKIILFHRQRMEFPVVDDLDIPGMGEIEGHYQPILSKDYKDLKIRNLKNQMIHEALADIRAWQFRHEKYARWEAGMNIKKAWPQDPIAWREKVKTFLRASKVRPIYIFFIAYFLKLGCLDGENGLFFAKQKMNYYKMIADIQKKISFTL
jgi:glycosyltransferase involved in cell wall biosynthesis